jgi:hypothetical protein
LGGLSALIEQAKADKRDGRFKKYVDSLFHLWFYQYTENFHTKPDSINDMLAGIKYLIYTRGDDK